MTKNQIYIQNLKVEEVPWNRLTTPYGRATRFPAYFEDMWKMQSMDAVKAAFNEVIANIEHQGTLWHCTPFAMIFLARIFDKALANMEKNKIAHFLVGELLDFFILIAECMENAKEMEEYAKELPLFADILKEEYLWPSEEEGDEERWEEDGIFSDDLIYSIWFYSYQVLLDCKPALNKIEDSIFAEEVNTLKELI